MNRIAAWKEVYSWTIGITFICSQAAGKSGQAVAPAQREPASKIDTTTPAFWASLPVRPVKVTLRVTDFDGTPLANVRVSASGMGRPSDFTDEDGVANLEAEGWVGYGIMVQLSTYPARRGNETISLRDDRVLPERIWVASDDIVNDAWSGSYQFKQGKRVTGRATVRVDDPTQLNEAQQGQERGGIRSVYFVGGDATAVAAVTSETYSSERLADVPTQAFLQSGHQVVEVPLTVTSQTDVFTVSDMNIHVLPSNRPVVLTTLPNYEAMLRDIEGLMVYGLTLIRLSDHRMWTFPNSTFGRFKALEQDPMVEPGRYLVMGGKFSASPSQIKVLNHLAAGVDLTSVLPTVEVTEDGPAPELEIDIAQVAERMRSLEARPPARK